jgi:hypothetical protein
MRPLLIALALTLASTACAQQGAVWYGGPYAPSRVAPTFNYYNNSAPVYPISANPFGRSYGYGWQQPAYRRELRELRWAIEDADFNRRWGR